MATQTKTTFKGLVDFTGTGNAGVRLNNLNTTQRDALTPATGMMIYNTTTSRFERYEGSSWLQIPVTTSDLSEGTNLYYTDERVDDRVSALLLGTTNQVTI